MFCTPVVRYSRSLHTKGEVPSFISKGTPAAIFKDWWRDLDLFRVFGPIVHTLKFAVISLCTKFEDSKLQLF